MPVLVLGSDERDPDRGRAGEVRVLDRDQFIDPALTGASVLMDNIALRPDTLSMK